jgi:uracil-DNA glycosylase
MKRPSKEDTAAPLIPEHCTLPRLKEAALGCRACPLWTTGTQTVFGEGLPTARLVLVGEIPGDQEDRQGLPFVGPAGRLLDQGLEIEIGHKAHPHATGTLPPHSVEGLLAGAHQRFLNGEG